MANFQFDKKGLADLEGAIAQDLKKAEAEANNVACQRDGTTVLPRGWDHLEVLSSMADLVSGVNGDAPALPVGGAFDDEGVRA